MESHSLGRNAAEPLQKVGDSEPGRSCDRSGTFCPNVTSFRRSGARVVGIASASFIQNMSGSAGRESLIWILQEAT